MVDGRALYVIERAEPWRQRRQESGGRTLNRVDSGLYRIRIKPRDRVRHSTIC